MSWLAKVINTVIKNGRRFVKVEGWGKDDTQEVRQAAPYGTDSAPVKGMVGVYLPTGEKGRSVLVGYINTGQLAAAGEHRTYSANAEGEVQFYIWQKADGTCEIGGTGDFMVRYNELETAFNQLRSDFNDLVTKYNAHTHATTGSIGTPTPPAGAPATPSAADISPAKIEEIKTLPSS